MLISQERRTEMKNLIVPMFFVLLGIALFLSPIFCLPTPVESEYSTTMSVDKPDKIENAISNVVSDLRKRDFVPVNLDVKWNPLCKTYIIYASGIDRTKLCNYEP